MIHESDVLRAIEKARACPHLSAEEILRELPVRSYPSIRIVGIDDPEKLEELVGALTEKAREDVHDYDHALSAAEIQRLYDPATRWEMYRPIQRRRWWRDLILLYERLITAIDRWFRSFVEEE